MQEIKSISKEIDFDYAHRVPKHESKCKNLHGHRGTIIVELTGDLIEEGPQTDMIMDFGFLKQILMDHVDALCDHGLILSVDDFKFVSMCYNENLPTKAIGGIFSDWHRETVSEVKRNGYWAGQTTFGKTYIINGAPTSEYLATHFFKVLAPKVLEKTNNKAWLSAITFKETPSSTATYRIQV
jgi:6-pyruvoyltetrahydropterin/6-carboxytetrahydropterin synthase